MDNDLERFLIAQQTYYRTALQEIKSGQKRSCRKINHLGAVNFHFTRSYYNALYYAANSHNCIEPSRCSRAYSRGSSIASAFNAQSAHGV